MVRAMLKAETVESFVRIVRGEYMEMPGLQLTRSQVKRFWGLDEEVCDTVLKTLTEEHFLHLTAAGRYSRMDPSGLSTRRAARHGRTPRAAE